MKATGIVKRVDDLGRIVIPKTVRRTMGIAEGTQLELFTENGTLIYKKYVAENELGGMVSNLMEAVEDMCVDLGPEKTGGIRRHIRDIQNILKQEA
nr:MAG TPA: stage V sporulation protein T [Caudoviricetes sp.]